MSSESTGSSKRQVCAPDVCQGGGLRCAVGRHVAWRSCFPNGPDSPPSPKAQVSMNAGDGGTFRVELGELRRKEGKENSKLVD
jgi:hypothetical protein